MSCSRKDLVPGPAHYATAVSIDGFARGAIAESHEGRPTKIESNPDHPASLGSTDAIMQTACLSLFEPTRSKTPLKGGQPASWDTFFGEAVERQTALDAKRGAGFCASPWRDRVADARLTGEAAPRKLSADARLPSRSAGGRRSRHGLPRRRPSAAPRTRTPSPAGEFSATVRPRCDCMRWNRRRRLLAHPPTVAADACYRARPL